MNTVITAAIVSSPLLPANKDANLAMMDQALGCLDADVDLVVFSEANIPGGFWKNGENDYPALAEPVPSGPSCQQALIMARKHAKTICCGLFERADDNLFVTHLLCTPEGLIGIQRKLFTEPGGPFASGQHLNILNWQGRRCLILACADILLPEGPIVAALQNPSLILSPTDCFYETQEPLIRRLLPVRAMDACATVLTAFSHDANNKDRRVLAGAIIQPNSHVTTLECRNPDETRTIRATLNLTAPRKPWPESLKVRAGILRRHL